MTLFQHFTACLKNQDFSRDSDFNSFMFCRFLGSNPKTIKIANTLNLLYKIPDEAQYNFARFIPNKPSSIRWIGQEASDKNKERINEIARNYKINKELAKDYFEILNELEERKK